MGVGPAVAIPAVCEKAGVAIQDIDVIELNEAFASQAVYVIETLGLDENKINLNGGAIALGHRTLPTFFVSFLHCCCQPHFGYLNACCTKLIADTLCSFFPLVYLSSGMHGCTSDCDALPDLEEPEQETWIDDHVYRLWHGHGCHLCKFFFVLHILVSALMHT